MASRQYRKAANQNFRNATLYHISVPVPVFLDTAMTDTSSMQKGSRERCALKVLCCASQMTQMVLAASPEYLG